MRIPTKCYENPHFLYPCISAKHLAVDTGEAVLHNPTSLCEYGLCATGNYPQDVGYRKLSMHAKWAASLNEQAVLTFRCKDPTRHVQQHPKAAHHYPVKTRTKRNRVHCSH